MRIARHEFGAAATALTVAFTAKSYSQIVRVKSRFNFAVIGFRFRTYAHLASAKANGADARVRSICGLNSVILEDSAADTQKDMGCNSYQRENCCNILALRDGGAITIATRIDGMLRCPSPVRRLESMFMSKGHAATIPLCYSDAVPLETY